MANGNSSLRQIESEDTRFRFNIVGPALRHSRQPNTCIKYIDQFLSSQAFSVKDFRLNYGWANHTNSVGPRDLNHGAHWPRKIMRPGY